MAKVLIVDDEQPYRDCLQTVLSERGHDTTTVQAGRTAIDLGVRFRPDVLVTDWMLKGRIHGLHVSQVLRTVDPNLKTILITGFLSPDLKLDAESARILQYLEKPFEARDVATAVDNAVGLQKSEPAAPAVAVIEVDGLGNILHANSTAKQLFASTSAGSDVERLDELFELASLARLVESNRRWIDVAPIAAKPLKWYVRSKKWPEGALLVLLREEDEAGRRNPTVDMLLGISNPERCSWPFSNHVLVIDDSRLIRDLSVRRLEYMGCTCHKAETPELALKIFAADSQIDIVILDYEMPGVHLGPLIKGLQAIRSSVKIVGNSGTARPEDFAVLGVDRFLQKPWQIDDLIAVLSQ